MITKIRGAENGRDLYFELVQRFPLRRIRSDAKLREAQEVVRSLVIRPRLDSAEVDYLQVLAGLVSDYEAAKFPRKAASDGEMLGFLIEMKGVSQVKTARDNGIAESTVSEVLAGKRMLTREHIAKLAAYFNVGESLFSLSNRVRR
ncbi:MAG: helix-turn-helix domain-containing protein [Planctomycetota bacterium]